MVMRFGRLDLNLLVAFNALLEERSVSRAAERLNMSQPAMSAALSKLREFFNDDLLVRSGRDMVPTAQANVLVGPVSEVLTAIQYAMAAKPSFDPSSAKRVFRIMMSDYIARVTLPRLMERLRATAPGLSIEVVASDATMHTKLERREIDLAVAPDRFLSPEHPSEHLIEDGYVVVVDQANRRIGDAITLDEYVSSEHVVANMSGIRQASFEDWFLENFDIQRRTVLTVPMFSLIPAFIVDTDYIATMHTELAQRMSRHYAIRSVTAPGQFPRLRQAVQWHRLSSHDLGLQWLRSTFVEVNQQRD